MRDVTRRGGTMVATGFEGQPSHPVKTVVDRVAHGYGFQPPQWYVAMQAVASTLGTAERFADVARDADLDKIEVWRELVRPEGLTAADLVDWRLGMAHLAGFVATLTASDREDLRAQAISSLSAEVPPLELPVLVLRAQC